MINCKTILLALNLNNELRILSLQHKNKKSKNQF